MRPNCSRQQEKRSSSGRCCRERIAGSRSGDSWTHFGTLIQLEEAAVGRAVVRRGWVDLLAEHGKGCWREQQRRSGEARHGP